MLLKQNPIVLERFMILNLDLKYHGGWVGEAIEEKETVKAEETGEWGEKVLAGERTDEVSIRGSLRPKNGK